MGLDDAGGLAEREATYLQQAREAAFPSDSVIKARGGQQPT